MIAHAQYFSAIFSVLSRVDLLPVIVGKFSFFSAVTGYEIAVMLLSAVITVIRHRTGLIMFQRLHNDRCRANRYLEQPQPTFF